MDVKQINSAIMFGTWSDVELSSIIDAVRFAHAGLQKQNIRKLSLGVTVEWHSAKRGITGRGQVVKIARKYVTVREGAMLWRVPAHMLRQVEVPTAA